MPTTPKTYTTTTELKTESGFLYNEDIADSVFDAKRVYANSFINSKLAMRYALPLATCNPTTWEGSPAEDYIKLIELLYASGLILVQEYGNEGIDTDKDGYRKKKEAEKMLTQLISGEMLLLDSNGKEMKVNANLNAASAGRVSIAGSVKDTSCRKFTTCDKY